MHENAAIMAPIDPVELQKWLDGETERPRARRVWRGIRHNYLPFLMGWEIRPGRVFFAVIRGIFFLFVAIWPIWVKFYDKTATLSWQEAGILSAVIVFAMAFNYGFDKFVKNFKEKGLREKLVATFSNEVRGLVFELSKIVRLRRPRDDLPAVKAMQKELLHCIKRVAEIHLDHFERTDIEVSLIVFNDGQCSHMRIDERTTTARTTGKVVPSEEIMAYYVAKSLAHRAVQDFLHDEHPFPKTGLSAPNPPYRSILLISLLDLSSGSPDTCVGVVAIDSKRPYHFWPGSKTDKLVVKVSPYCMWITLLLGMNRAHRLHRHGRMPLEERNVERPSS